MAARTIDFAAARRAMVVSQLRPEGVTDKAVLAAMSTVAREDHLPPRLGPLAYMDRPLSIDDGSPVMSPAELGRLLTELAPLPAEKALVVGPGGSYSAAVLEAMGLNVERAENIVKLPAKKKFDLILVEGAVEFVPDELAARLKSHGRIGLAKIDRGVARLAVGSNAHGSLGFTNVADAQVPLLAGFEAPKPAFIF